MDMFRRLMVRLFRKRASGSGRQAEATPSHSGGDDQTSDLSRDPAAWQANLKVLRALGLLADGEDGDLIERYGRFFFALVN